MKNNKLDIFEKNAEFFERFNNSLEDTTEDRHERTRFTVTGLENKVEFAVSNAQGRIKKAESDAVDRLNKVNGITNDELISKSVGAGKWMREGAYGLGSRGRVINPDIVPIGENGFYAGTGSGSGAFRYGPYIHASRSYGGSERALQIGYETPESGLRYRSFVNNLWGEVIVFYDNSNTTTDKSGVLHSGGGTPIDTLNVSDMADTVIDRDDVTVTSGAVYRALGELRAEIALLKGKLNE